MSKYLILILLLVLSNLFPQENRPIKIGSKKFTENIILGELAAQLARTEYDNVQHLKELGGTRVLWNALLKGDIDLYPDYTGTLKQEILSNEKVGDFEDLKNKLEKFDIKISEPLGFNNTYALGMKKSKAENLNINTISDLKNHPELSFGFSNEFMDRNDGWKGLQNTYNLPQTNVNGLDHDLAYRGLENESIDVIDLYSTDAEIEYYDLKVLKDDLKYFTDYYAVYVYRNDLEKNHQEVLKEILKLENSIPETTMVKLNAKVKIDRIPDEVVASDFLKEKFNLETEFKRDSFWSRLWINTKEHLFMVIISLSAAILLSIPLGIFAHKFKKAEKAILGITGIIQTIPSLALLVFMIPLLGIGSWAAIFALFLYSLLPIVRNTFSGLEDIALHIRESAEVLGISSFAKLRLIELPISSRSILAGIKTSAVINVGTATLGALIGAGGYGQPILTGIRLDDISLILEGAIPAALLALLVQWFFDLVELVLVPKGLKLKSN